MSGALSWKRSSAHWMLVAAVYLASFGTEFAQGQGVIPGTGRKLTDVGDTFEDANWSYSFNVPKASYEQDNQTRDPLGGSSNGRLFESPKRGQPDVIRRFETPDGGIPGSNWCLLMQSLHTGRPGMISGQQQQDDLLVHFNSSVGQSLPVGWNPSVVVRVYIPPFQAWERRTGASFGYRAAVTGIGPKEEKMPGRFGLFGRRGGGGMRMVRGVDQFYPGFFIQLNRKEDTGAEKDTAMLLVRGDSNGMDFNGPVITEPGWWTLGMSFTRDGMCHFYAGAGSDDLTAKDHIASCFPQSVHCQVLNTMFFNVVNIDDGRSWSTPWVIDDPSFFVESQPPGAVVIQNPPTRR